MPMFLASKQKSLIFKLLSRVIISAVIPCVLISLVLILFTHNRVYQMTVNNTIGITKTTAELIYSHLENTKNVLAAVTGSRGFREMEISRQKLLLENLLPMHPQIEEVRIINLNGQEVLKLSSEKGEVLQRKNLQNVFNENEFISARRKKIHWSSVHLSKEDCFPDVTLSLLFEGLSGKPAGVLSAEVCLRGLQSILCSIKLGERGYFYLVDNQGNLIIPPEEETLSEMKNLTFIPPVKKFLSGIEEKGHQTTKDYIGLKGLLVHGLYQPVKEMNWAVIAEFPTEELTVILRSITLGIGGLGFFGIIGIVIGGFLSLRPLVKSIEKLQKGAEIVGKGNLDYQLQINTGDEIERLANTFNQMSASLKEARTELEEIIGDLERKVEERTTELVKKEKMATIGELAGSIAHELRNPLGDIKNSIYFLSQSLHNNPDERIEEILKIIKRQIDISNQIISGLLDFSRSPEYTFTRAKIDQVINETLLKAIIPGNIEISSNLDKNLPPIEIDCKSIEGVFLNLINNAIQSMPQGGQLTITTRRQDNFLEIEFADTGQGIPEENLKKIFDPLFSTKAKGTGLGLAISKKFVEKHNGYIQVKSAVNQGTVFVVGLPV